MLHLRDASDELVWVDREGQQETVGPEPGDYTWFSLSPDGLHLALERDGDIHTFDILRGTLNRVTTDAAYDESPLWTPDGSGIVFLSNRSGVPELFLTPADGTGTLRKILDGGGDVIAFRPSSWAPDRETLLFTDIRVGITADVAAFSIEGDELPRQLVDNGALSSNPTVSPDGRWIAYESNLSGRDEIYIERFPEQGNRQRISQDGGRWPRWSPDGTELFYRSVDGRQMMAVRVETVSDLVAGVPEVLFEGDFAAPFAGVREAVFAVSPDGDRFLLARSGGASESAQEVVFVQNWGEELRARVPTH